jgi:hypothetical protein
MARRRHGPSLKQARAFVRELLGGGSMLRRQASRRREDRGRGRPSAPFSPVQLKALELCQSFPTSADGWFSLEEAGLARSTIRALQKLGALQARRRGFPGQVIGQLYRITTIGLAAVTGPKK